MVLITIKVGRHNYQITEEDRFMDNGSIIQLLTQSKQYVPQKRRFVHPVLSKREVARIEKFEKRIHEHKYGSSVTVFSLKM